MGRAGLYLGIFPRGRCRLGDIPYERLRQPGDVLWDYRDNALPVERADKLIIVMLQQFQQLKLQFLIVEFAFIQQQLKLLIEFVLKFNIGR